MDGLSWLRCSRDRGVSTTSTASAVGWAKIPILRRRHRRIPGNEGRADVRPPPACRLTCSGNVPELRACSFSRRRLLLQRVRIEPKLVWPTMVRKKSALDLRWLNAKRQARMSALTQAKLFLHPNSGERGRLSWRPLSSQTECVLLALGGSGRRRSAAAKPGWIVVGVVVIEATPQHQPLPRLDGSRFLF